MNRMKKILKSVFSAALALSLVVGIPGAAWANNDGSDSKYRVNDFAGSLTESQELELSKAARAEVSGLQFDFLVCISDKDAPAASLAESFFGSNDCGYGQDNDGIILCIKPNGESAVFVDGIGSVIFSELATTQLTPEQKAQLAAQIADMRQRLGLDFVFYSDNSSYGLSRGLYAADFYQFNGYGAGDEYSGVIYFVCMEKGNRGFWTAALGSARELLIESNVNAMDDLTYDLFVDGDYGKAILTQFDNLNALYTDGHLPFDFAPIVGAGIISLIIGLVSGSKELALKKRAMKTVATAGSAASYSSGLALTRSTDELYDTVVTRTKHKEESSSSSGGRSGGSSSYSSSYSSSGGASFSGGGRSF